MTDEGLLQKQVDAGRQAEAVLENPVFKAVAADIEKELVRAFKGEDDDVAAEARRQVRTFETLLTKFVNIHKRGLSAHKQLVQLRHREAEGESTKINDMRGIA